jgi:hypothetical protein
MDVAEKSAAQFVATWQQGCAAGHGACAAVIRTVALLLTNLGAALPHSGAKATTAHGGVKALLTVTGDLSAVASCPSFPAAFGSDADVASLALRLLAATAVSEWAGDDVRPALTAALAVVLGHARVHRPHVGSGSGSGGGGLYADVAALAARAHHVRVLQATGEVSDAGARALRVAQAGAGSRHLRGVDARAES